MTTTSLTVTDTPTPEQMRVWWQALQADPSRDQAYTHKMPQDITTFLWDAPMVSVLLVERHTVCGAYWFHDIGTTTDGLRYGWGGAYLLPAFRRQHSAAIGQAFVDIAARRGILVWCIATRADNLAAQYFGERYMGLHRVGLYPAWAPFGGQWRDVVLYVKRPQDTTRCWQLAAQRAVEFRQWWDHQVA